MDLGMRGKGDRPSQGFLASATRMELPTDLLRGLSMNNAH